MNKPPDKMLTVGEINSTFAEKGIQVQLPLPASYLVRSLQILERKKIPGGVALLLSVRFINDKGEEALRPVPLRRRGRVRGEEEAVV